MRSFIEKQKEMAVKGTINEDELKQNFFEINEKIKDTGENVIVITSDVILKGDEIEIN
jgi:hypothetical protein